MCEFCNGFDLGSAGFELDGSRAYVVLAGGNSKIEEKSRFSYCPMCGDRIDAFRKNIYSIIECLEHCNIENCADCKYRLFESGDCEDKLRKDAINALVRLSNSV